MKTTEQKIWYAIKSRCTNTRDVKYLDYGAKGISICERWMTFNNFLLDMGYRPTPKHSIDRINNSGNYEPSNCRWATAVEQSANKSSCTYLTVGKITKTYTEWARELGLSRGCIEDRIKAGLSPEQVIGLPKYFRFSRLKKAVP